MNLNQFASLTELVNESVNLVKPFKKIDETYNPESLSFPITQEPSKWIRQLTLAFQDYTDLLLNGHNDQIVSDLIAFEPHKRFDCIKWNVLHDFLDAMDPDADGHDIDGMTANCRKFIDMVSFRLTRHALEKILNYQSKK